MSACHCGKRTYRAHLRWCLVNPTHPHIYTGPPPTIDEIERRAAAATEQQWQKWGAQR